MFRPRLISNFVMTTLSLNEKAHGGPPETLGFLWAGRGNEHSLYGGSHGVWVEFLNDDTLGQGSSTVRTPLSGWRLPERRRHLFKVLWARWLDLKMSLSMVEGSSSTGDPSLLLSPEMSHPQLVTPHTGNLDG